MSAYSYDPETDTYSYGGRTGTVSCEHGKTHAERMFGSTTGDRVCNQCGAVIEGVNFTTTKTEEFES